MIIFDPYFIRAIAAGVAVSLVFGVLGCFTLWRRMAYFGDSLSHCALLGIAFGLLFGINVNIGIIFVCGFFALILAYLQHKKFLTTDSLLGIMAHASLSIGMVIIGILKGENNGDVHEYLFGNILNLSTNNVLIIYFAAAIILLLLIKNWAELNLVTISEDLARAEGVNIFCAHLILMLSMSIIVAIAINIVGILLITSMLVIPAANARQLAKSPESMAIFSAILAIIAVITGICFSSYFKISVGPSVVVSSTILFVITALFTLINKTIHK